MNYQDYKDFAVQQRRHLHENPELGREEFKTSAHCQKLMTEFGYTVTPCFETGFYADLVINPSFKTIAFRADMDALPAVEKAGEVVCSNTTGVAHLCGHDTHMAVALTAAKIMAEHKDKMTANVRFLFQPSEEMFRGGAKGMIEAGCLNNVDFVYGLHNDPQIDTGKIAIRYGVMSSNGDQFKLGITGKSAHATVPHRGLDAIAESVRLLTRFKAIIADNIDPNHAALISTCMIKAGEAPNILAPFAELEGSIRSFDLDVQATLVKHFNDELEQSKRRGFGIDLDIKGYPAIVNHKEQAQLVMDKAADIIGKENVLIDHPPMVGSEDFSFFTQEKPGAFFFLGSGDHAKGINNPLHSNPFIVNEDCLMIGASIYVSLVGL